MSKRQWQNWPKKKHWTYGNSSIRCTETEDDKIQHVPDLLGFQTPSRKKGKSWFSNRVVCRWATRSVKLVFRVFQTPRAWLNIPNVAPNYIITLITMSDDGFLEKHCSYSSIPPHESQSRTQSTQAAFAKMQQNRFLFCECSLSGANTSGTKCKIHLQDLQ